ncbi:MAG TPA: HNH endonuclease [Terriglobales bacterium]|nr:HNH endonuclease [Terriglobales bacterium]
MRYWVGVTDNRWFNFLSQRNPDEVNFWHPSGRPPFKYLDLGAPFLFKLKKPNHHVAGGGYFVKYSSLPLSMVWDAFGEKNGAGDRATFEAMIRRLAPDPSAKDPYVGCSVLTEPFFLAPSEWLPAPADWASNNVRGQYYDSEQGYGAALWASIQARFEHYQAIAHEEAPRYGKPTLVRPRLGQGGFQVSVLDAYDRRCAITGERTLPTLEAAHIRDYAKLGPHDVRNGLLLRADFHKLFDAGLVTITPDLNVEVSPKIREQWFNGKAYYRLHGQRLANLPANDREHPGREYLTWHNENQFQG